MPDKKTYFVGGEAVEVNDTDVQSFLKNYPDAKEGRTFVVGGDTVDVELPHEQEFLKNYPDAKYAYGDPVKKKVPTEPLPGLGGGLPSPAQSVYAKGEEWSSTKLSPNEEAMFQNFMKSNPRVREWRSEFIDSYGEPPRIDGGDYDYRGAWKARIVPQPTFEPETGKNRHHWGSIGKDGRKLKSPSHPTKWKSDYMQMFGENPDEAGVTEEQALNRISSQSPTQGSGITPLKAAALTTGTSLPTADRLLKETGSQKNQSLLDYERQGSEIRAAKKEVASLRPDLKASAMERSAFASIRNQQEKAIESKYSGYKDLTRQANEEAKKLVEQVDPWLFKTTSMTGATIVDNKKTAEWAAKKAVELGLPSDGDFQELLWNEANARVTYGLMQPDVIKLTEEKYRKKTGKTLDQAQREFMNVEGKKAAVEKTLSDYSKQMSAQAEKELNDRFVQTFGADPKTLNRSREESFANAIKSMEADVNSKYARNLSLGDGNFSGSEEEFSAYQKDMSAVKQQAEQLAAAYDAETKQMVEITAMEVNAINERYNRAFAKRRDEALAGFDSEMKKLSEQYGEKFRKEVDPIYKDAFAEVEKKKRGEVTKLGEAFGSRMASMNPTLDGASQFFGQWLSGAGSGIQAISSSMGWRGGEVLGARMQQYFDMGDAEINTLSEFFSDKGWRSSGQLMGSMTTSMIPALAVGVATRGAGGSAMLSGGVAALTSFGAESMDIAGRMYDDTFRDTGGDAVKSTQRANKVWESQMMLLPTYGLEMLPFFGKIGGSMAKRIVAGGLMEYGTETILQEYPQNVFEKLIKADESLGAAPRYISVFKDPEGKKVSLEHTALQTIPTLFLGGAGGANTKLQEDRTRNRLIQALASKMDIGKMSEADIDVSIAEMTRVHGPEFAKAFATSNYLSGMATQEQFEQMSVAADRAARLYPKLEDTQLTEEHRGVALSLMMKAEKYRDMSNKESDPIMKKSIESKLSNLERNIDSMFSGDNPEYGEIVFQDGSRRVLTIEELKLNMQRPEFKRLLLSGVTVNAFGKESEEISKRLTSIADEAIREADVNAKREKQNEQFQKQRETALEAKWNIAPYSVVEPTPEIEKTIARVEAGVPSSAVQMNETSDWLYSEVKRLRGMKTYPNRDVPLKIIEATLSQLEKDLDMVEEFKNTMREDGVEVPKSKSETDAVQEQGAAELLPRQQEEVGKAGGEREGMGQGEQQKEPSVKSFADKVRDELAKKERPQLSVSTADNTQGFGKADKTRATKQSIQDKYKDAVVVDSEDKLPRTIQEHIKETGATGTVKGVTHMGNIYLVAGNIDTMGDADATYRHEKLGHRNVNEYMKNRLNGFAETLVRNADTAQKKLLESIAQDYFGTRDISSLSQEDLRTLGKEYIARVAEGEIKNPTVLEKIRQFFKEMMIALGLDMKISDAEIRTLIANAERYAGNSRFVEYRAASSVNKALKKLFDRTGVEWLKNIQLSVEPQPMSADEKTKLLKKAFGETAARLIRAKMPVAFAQDTDRLVEFLKKKVPVKSHMTAVVEAMSVQIEQEFLKQGGATSEQANVSESAEDLLRKVGYTFNVAKSREEGMRFVSFYKKGEISNSDFGGSIICTLRPGTERFRDSFVTFVVRDDADTTVKASELTQDNINASWADYLIKKGRKNADGTFDLSGIKNSEKDPYSTSVLSIQVPKRGGTIKSISRYNHQVGNPDVVYSNLDNIVDGLHNAFYDYFGVTPPDVSREEIPEGFKIDSKGSLFKVAGERNGVYWGDGFYITEDGETVLLDPNKEIIADGYLFSAGKSPMDVTDVFEWFEGIQIEKAQLLGSGRIRLTGDGIDIEIKAEGGHIVALKSDTITQAGSNFLYSNTELKELSLPNLTEVGHRFLFFNKELKELSLPNLTQVWSDFLYSNTELKELSLPNLTQVGHNFLYYNTELKELSLPNLTQVGHNFLYYNTELKELSLPNLTQVGYRFLFSNKSVLVYAGLDGRSSISINNTGFEVRLPNRLPTKQYYYTKEDINDIIQKEIAHGKEIESRPSFAKQKETHSEQAKKIADKIRRARIHKKGSAFTATPVSLAIDAAIESAALVVEASGSVADFVSTAVDALRASDWWIASDTSKRARRRAIKEIREAALAALGVNKATLKKARKNAEQNRHYTKTPIVRAFTRINPMHVPANLIDEYKQALEELSSEVPRYEALAVSMQRIVDGVNEHRQRAAERNSKKKKGLVGTEAGLDKKIDEINSSVGEDVKSITSAISQLQDIAEALDAIEFDDSSGTDTAIGVETDMSYATILQKALDVRGRIDELETLLERTSANVKTDLAQSILDIFREVVAAGPGETWTKPHTELFNDLRSLLSEKGVDTEKLLESMTVADLARLEAIVSNMLPVSVPFNGTIANYDGEVDYARLSPIVDRLYSMSREGDAAVEDAKKIAKDLGVASNLAEKIAAVEVQEIAHSVLGDKTERYVTGARADRQSPLVNSLFGYLQESFKRYNDGLQEALKFYTESKKKHGIGDSLLQRDKLGIISLYIRDYLDGKSKRKDGGHRDYFREMMYSTGKDGNIELDANGVPVINYKLGLHGDPSVLEKLGLAALTAAGKTPGLSYGSSTAARSAFLRLKEVLDSLPAELHVDGKKENPIDPEKIWESFSANDGKALTKNERDFVSDVVSWAEKNLGNMQESANEARGNIFKWIPFHVRRIVKMPKSGNVTPNVKATANRGTIRLESPSGKEAKDNSASQVDFDFQSMFFNGVEATNRDYHIGRAVRRLNSLLARVRVEAKPELATELATALSETMTREFVRHRGWVESAIMSVVNLHIKHTLMNITRTIAESLVVISTLPFRSGRLSSVHHMLSTMKMTEAQRKEQANIISLMDDLGSPAATRTMLNRHMDMAGTEIREMKWDERLTAFNAALTEPLIVKGMWMPAFDAAFERETGQKFNMQKYVSDPEYRFEHRHEMLIASREANNEVYSVIGPPHIGFRRKSLRGPLGIFNVSTDSPLIKTALVFTSFPRRDWMALKRNTFTAMKAAASGDVGDSGRAASKAFGALASSSLYSMVAGTTAAIGTILIAKMFGDDEEEERLLKQIDDTWSFDGLYDSTLKGVVGGATSKYGVLSKGALLIGVSAYYGALEKRGEKETMKKVREWSRNNLYSDPLPSGTDKYSMSTLTYAVLNLFSLYDSLERLYVTTTKTAGSLIDLISDVDSGNKKLEDLPSEEREAYEAANAIYGATTLAFAGMMKAPIPERASFERMFKAWDRQTQNITQSDAKNQKHNKEMLAEAQDKLLEEFPADAKGDPITMRTPEVVKLVDHLKREYRLKDVDYSTKNEISIQKEIGSKVERETQDIVAYINAKRNGTLADGKSDVQYSDLVGKSIEGISSTIVANDRSYAFQIKEAGSRNTYFLKEADKLKRLGIIGQNSVTEMREALEARYRYVEKKAKK
jgi:hypothetical protein